MKRERVKQELSQEEFNAKLKKVKFGHIIVFGEKPKNGSRKLAWITFDATKVFLTFRETTRLISYFTRLDRDSETCYVTPIQVWIDLIATCGRENIPNLRGKYGYKEIKYGIRGDSKVKWEIECPGGYHYHNEKLVDTYIENCYGYDINSSYSFAMTKDMPDTRVKPKLNCKVNKGEIGFCRDGSVCLDGWAEFVFPLIKSPFIPFIDKYYPLKVKSAKNRQNKAKYKQILNIPTGYVQRLNPFLRNAIIYYAKEYVKQFIDENTLYVNTDSIISSVERPDIPIHPTELGKFKCDHRGTFMYWAQGCYEWNGEKHNQGIPLYMLNNSGVLKYKFDKEKMEVVLNGPYE